MTAEWITEPGEASGDLASLSLQLWSVNALLLDAESAGTLLAGLPYHSGAASC